MSAISRLCRCLCAVALLTVPLAAAAAEPGESLYALQCAACHGIDRSGVEGLGTPLTASTFVAATDADGLVAFLNAGRMPNDPASITGGVMPGFGWMPDEDLRAIAEYLQQ